MRRIVARALLVALYHAGLIDPYTNRAERKHHGDYLLQGDEAGRHGLSHE